jgi:hypothetical protein
MAQEAEGERLELFLFFLLVAALIVSLYLNYDIR